MIKTSVCIYIVIYIKSVKSYYAFISCIQVQGMALLHIKPGRINYEILIVKFQLNVNSYEVINFIKYHFKHISYFNSTKADVMTSKMN